MDFGLSEEQQRLQGLFRAFAESEVGPVAAAADREASLPAALLLKLAANGFMGAVLPKSYGGAGMDFVTYTLFAEALARHCLSTATLVGIHTMLSAMTIADGGSDAVKAAFLPRLAGGELGTFALTEPEAGSDPGSMQTRAVHECDYYVLDGVKSWVSNAGQAGVHVVIALTEPDKRHQGMTAFVVDANAPGITLGPREPTLGLRGVDIRTVAFEGCRVPEGNVLGEVNHGWRLVLRAFARVRLSLAAAGLGAAEGALALGVRFAAERKQFGVALAQKQAIQDYVADCAVEIEALRHLVSYTAWLADTGQDFALSASMAKYKAARVANETADKMLQVHGGYGFSEASPIARIARDVRALRLLGGTDEIQRYAVARGVFEGVGVRVQP